MCILAVGYFSFKILNTQKHALCHAVCYCFVITFPGICLHTDLVGDKVLLTLQLPYAKEKIK